MPELPSAKADVAPGPRALPDLGKSEGIQVNGVKEQAKDAHSGKEFGILGKGAGGAGPGFGGPFGGTPPGGFGTPGGFGASGGNATRPPFAPPMGPPTPVKGGDKISPTAPALPLAGALPPLSGGIPLADGMARVEPVHPVMPERKMGGGAGPQSYNDRGGWQPNGGRPLVPNDLLDTDKELDAFRQRPESRVMAAPALAPGALGSGVTTSKMVPTATDPAGSMGKKDAKDAKDGEDTYLKAVARVKREADEWSLKLRERMKDNAAVPNILPGEDRGNPTMFEAKAPGAPLHSDAIALYRVQAAVPSITPLVVREYAAPRPGTAEKGDLHKEADTILWQPVIVLPGDGKAKIGFNLGSAEGGYQVMVAGHTLDGKDGQNGRIGAIRGIIPVAPNIPTTQPTATPPVPPGGP
jgi:hypothetical protein